MTEMLKNLTSEFIGTYLLVLTVGCNVLSGSGTWAALSIASVLMVSIYALGSVSGAHFNPAVTLTCFLADTFQKKETNVTKALAYMGTQLVAGVLAGLSYLWIHGTAFNLEPGTGFSWKEAAAVEILYTFMLCFVVLRCCATVTGEKSDAEFYGLAIGWVIVAGGYAGGWISKGAFNPAVAFGIDVASAGQGLYWCLPYLIFEFIGAAIAAGLHTFVEENKSDKKSMGQKVTSEFLGTYFLVLTVGLNVLGQSPAPALSIAASLMCMIYALGDVSGAHFNPAVTTALFLSGKFKAGDIAPYMGGQFLGGLAAAFTYTGIVGKAVPLGVGTGYSWSDAAFAEIMYTFVLCFVVLNVAAINKAAKHIYGLAIGFTIVAGGYAIGAVSGGSLNPAVSLGLDASNASKGGTFSNCLAYTAFELTGAAMAAGAFYVARPEEFAKGGKLPLGKTTSYGSV